MNWKLPQCLVRIALIGWLWGANAAEPAEAKRIYIANDDHTDYMWTLDEEGYRKAFLEMLDYYLGQIDATTNNSSPHQARWNCDGSFWLWTYEKSKSAPEFERLIQRVRDGHISAPLNALASCYGGQPLEAVLRGMYYAGSLERRFGLRFPLAVAMENQTLPYGLGALWAGSGAKYSWKGICACANLADANDREHEVYWWRGPDGSRILMKWNSLLVNNMHMGGYAEARDPFKIVDFVDSDPSFLRRYSYKVVGAFGKGWDDAKTLTDEFIEAALAKSTPERQVIVSNEQDFFEDFERTYGSSLPTVTASFGNEWDLYSASMPEVSARVRRAVEKLRNAEAMAALVSIHEPDFMKRRVSERDQAWMNLGLYWEHDWTADGTIVTRDARAAWQRRTAEQIENYVETLHRDAASALGKLIQADNTTTRFFAFNSLSWPRTAAADLSWTNTQPIHVVDLQSGRSVPSQIVTNNGGRSLRVLARDVPATGYKVFEIRSGAGGDLPNAATLTGNILENDFYRITVAERGAITSLIDKTRGNRELARTINGRAINDLGPSQGQLRLENAGPVSVTLLATAPEPHQHTTRITVIRDGPRVEISNEIAQNFTNVPTWSFAFNLDAPELWHEEIGAVIRAKLLGEGGHYSPRNARYDWLTLNHFAALSEGRSSSPAVVLSSADCAFMKFGNSAAGHLDTATPQLSVLVGGQVDGPKLGIPAQGGDTRFTQRFALQILDRFQPAEAMKFALEHQSPLVTGLIAGNGAFPEKSFSLLKISNSDVLLWALKPADDGAGLIVRVWNLSAEAQNFTLALAAGIAEARQATHIETDLAKAPIVDGGLSASASPSQVMTFRLMPEIPPLSARPGVQSGRPR